MQAALAEAGTAAPAADAAATVWPAAAPAGTTTDFAACYRQQLPGLVWFVMSLGASAEEAADAAQAAFAAAFPVWDTIRHPQAWLRRVAQRARTTVGRRAGRSRWTRLPTAPGR